MTNEKCRVVSHREIGSGYRYIEFEASAIAASATPGQFVHVRVPALEKSALRRPFSIFNAEDGRLELLYKTVGRGTAALNEVKPGDEVEVMGPLGHGFPLKCAGEALLVGGGYGVAPLYFLSRILLSSMRQSVNPPLPHSPTPPNPPLRRRPHQERSSRARPLRGAWRGEGASRDERRQRGHEGTRH